MLNFFKPKKQVEQPKETFIKFNIDNNDDVHVEYNYVIGEEVAFIEMLSVIFNGDIEKECLNKLPSSFIKVYNSLSTYDKPVVEPYQAFQGKTIGNPKQNT